jgi:uncharacterized delta-60 repeat protein
MDGLPAPYLARFDAARRLDLSFGERATADGAVRVLVAQLDGRLLLGGDFTTLHGLSRPGIARLRPDGVPDETFQPGSGPGGSARGARTIESVAVQPDGRILIGGFFSEWNRVPRHGLARLESNGSLDPSFAPNAGIEAAYPVALQADGRILIAGYFNRPEQLIRLDPDGTEDHGFRFGFSYAHVSAIALLPNADILLGGNSSGFPEVLPFSPSGVQRPWFRGQTFHDISMNALVVQTNGRILVGARSVDFQPGITKGLGRLLPNGEADPEFVGRIEVNGAVRAIALRPDGGIVMGGTFRTVNGRSRTRLAWLDDAGYLLPEIRLKLEVRATQPATVLLGGDAGTALVLETSTNLVDWRAIAAFPHLNDVQTWNGTHDPGPVTPARFFRARCPTVRDVPGGSGAAADGEH